MSELRGGKRSENNGILESWLDAPHLTAPQIDKAKQLYRKSGSTFSLNTTTVSVDGSVRVSPRPAASSTESQLARSSAPAALKSVQRSSHKGSAAPAISPHRRASRLPHTAQSSVNAALQHYLQIVPRPTMHDYEQPPASSKWFMLLCMPSDMIDMRAGTKLCWKAATALSCVISALSCLLVPLWLMAVRKLYRSTTGCPHNAMLVAAAGLVVFLLADLIYRQHVISRMARASNATLTAKDLRIISPHAAEPAGSRQQSTIATSTSTAIRTQQPAATVPGAIPSSTSTAPQQAQAAAPDARSLPGHHQHPHSKEDVALQSVIRAHLSKLEWELYHKQASDTSAWDAPARVQKICHELAVPWNPEADRNLEELNRILLHLRKEVGV